MVVKASYKTTFPKPWYFLHKFPNCTLYSKRKFQSRKFPWYNRAATILGFLNQAYQELSADESQHREKSRPQTPRMGKPRGKSRKGFSSKPQKQPSVGICLNDAATSDQQQVLGLSFIVSYAGSHLIFVSLLQAQHFNT